MVSLLATLPVDIEDEIFDEINVELEEETDQMDVDYVTLWPVEEVKKVKEIKQQKITHFFS